MTWSAATIKAIHTAIFVILSAALAVLLYEAILDRISVWSWIAAALLAVEGVLLAANGWKCPLTAYAESLGSHRGEVADLFLPKWFADRVFRICGIVFAFAVILQLVRLLA